jgi:hypothetical protein
MADSPSTQPTTAVAVVDLSNLAERTHADIQKTYETVLKEYLNYRHVHYHEKNPSIETDPTPVNTVHRGGIVPLAENALKIIPQDIRNIPVIGGLLVHLEDVIDLNTFAEDERRGFHDLTVVYLLGIQDGIQPSFVQWYLDMARKLQQPVHPRYYFAYPWEGLLYLNPEKFIAFSKAIQTGDASTIKNQIIDLGNRIIDTLRDPMKAQSTLAFSGPNEQARRRNFHMKTTTAVVVGTVVAFGVARAVIQRNPSSNPGPSIMTPIPQDILAHRKNSQLPGQ